MTERELLFGAVAVAILGAIVWGVRRRKSTSSPQTERSQPSPSPQPGTPVTLAPALSKLRSEIDSAWPNRSRASDGGMPSVEHHAKNPNSDHERGDAFDFTVDRADGPDPDSLAELAKSDNRVSYVIWNRRIANKNVDGNAWRPYELTAIQTDPHTSHVHVSVRDYARADASPWNVADGVRSGTQSPRMAQAAPPVSYTQKMEALPTGYASMKQSRVTQARADWAKLLLHDQSFAMGQVRASDIGGPLAARVEIHSADAHIDHPHRGISLYEQPTDIT